MLAKVKEFLKDKQAYDMFITGPAGTGKTTSLYKIIEYFQAEKVKYTVCAYTHQACKVLQEKLPKNAEISTLHSYLKKRPGINDKALKHEHVETTTKFADSEQVSVIIIDEFSMAGEKDYLDLMALQENEEGLPKCKVIYVGDPYQLPPVKDQQTIFPQGKYHIKLTKVHRTEQAPLLNLLSTLVNYLEGTAPIEPLAPSDCLLRNMDIVEEYQWNKSNSKTMLAWTNKQVQFLNQAAQGREVPQEQDSLWNASLRHTQAFIREVPAEAVTAIYTPVGPLLLGSKYKTLEFLKSLPFVQFYSVFDLAMSRQVVIATCFGTYNYKQLMLKLADNAVQDNKRIANHIGSDNVKAWCLANSSHKLARQRAAAWRRYLACKESLCQVDFPHCTTIHKAQGSTYNYVYLDAKDLAQCRDTEMHLRLFYVAVSRARLKVITN